MEQFWAEAIEAVRRCDAPTLAALKEKGELWPVQYELECALWLTDANIVADKLEARRAIYELLKRSPEECMDLPAYVGGFWRADGSCRWDDDPLRREVSHRDFVMGHSVPPLGLPILLIGNILAHTAGPETAAEFMRRERDSEWHQVRQVCMQNDHFVTWLIDRGEINLARDVLLQDRFDGEYATWATRAMRCGHFSFALELVRQIQSETLEEHMQDELDAYQWVAEHQRKFARDEIQPPDWLSGHIRTALPDAPDRSAAQLLWRYRRNHSSWSVEFIDAMEGRSRDAIWRELDVRFIAARTVRPHTNTVDLVARHRNMSRKMTAHVLSWRIKHRATWLPKAPGEGTGALYIGFGVLNRATFLYGFWSWWGVSHVSHAMVWFYAMVIVSDGLFRVAAPASLTRFIAIGARLPQELQRVLAQATQYSVIADYPAKSDEECLKWLLQMLLDPFFSLAE